MNDLARFRWQSFYKSWPVHGWIGLALVSVFWILNWTLPGPRTHWGFFPLWLGYSLTIDALVLVRKGHSLFTRNALAYAGLFLASAPAWWLFEWINWRTQNWSYQGEELFTGFQYFMLSTFSFSTVMPAVFGTAELASTSTWIRRIKAGRRFHLQPRTLMMCFGAGWLMLALLMWRPRYFFPLVWGAVYLILEPVNAWLGNRTLLDDIQEGDWRAVISLCTGCLICGFFWEMWNYYAYPKWIYHIPFVDFLRLFEMPTLGYLGYLPFSLELFALYHLIGGPFRQGKLQNYIQLK
jgi:hypothetical protein